MTGADLTLVVSSVGTFLAVGTGAVRLVSHLGKLEQTLAELTQQVQRIEQRQWDQLSSPQRAQAHQRDNGSS